MRHQQSAMETLKTGRSACALGSDRVVMPTMAEVARRAGVSVSTVSHVINRTRFVSPAKAKVVNDAIAAMGYQPN